MKYITFLLISIFLIAGEVRSQNKLVFSVYNVENLFDTADDPHKNDNEFLPTGKKQWDLEKYRVKLQHLAKVIDGLSPDLLGLVEVENRQVLEDLIAQPNLLQYNFKIVHEESPDFRGIDVALLYDSRDFNYLWHKTESIKFPWGKKYSTRDILYVCGAVGKNDTLLVFVNHWPSRRGGQKKSEPNRVYVARKLRNLVNNYQRLHPDYHILIGGDFNDTPTDFSIAVELEALSDKACLRPYRLYNASAKAAKKEGTYKYRGKWFMLDQIIVSANLLDGKGLEMTPESFKVFSPEWLKQPNGKYKGYPLRTYAGKKYLGGYSDHFPVKIELKTD